MFLIGYVEINLTKLRNLISISEEMVESVWKIGMKSKSARAWGRNW